MDKAKTVEMFDKLKMRSMAYSVGSLLFDKAQMDPSFAAGLDLGLHIAKKMVEGNNLWGIANFADQKLTDGDFRRTIEVFDWFDQLAEIVDRDPDNFDKGNGDQLCENLEAQIIWGTEDFQKTVNLCVKGLIRDYDGMVQTYGS